MFHGEQCACGWKKPNDKTSEVKRFGFEENKKQKSVNFREMGAWKYLTQEKKKHIEKLERESPKTEMGSMKEEVANYWLYEIGKMNKGFEALLKKRGFGNV